MQAGCAATASAMRVFALVSLGALLGLDGRAAALKPVGLPRPALARLGASALRPAAMSRRPSTARAVLRLDASDETTSITPANVASVLAWVALVTFAFGFAPGEVGAPGDADLVSRLIANPTSPIAGGVSPIFALVFNLFVPVPAMLAALLLPTSRGQRLPALPFVAASTFVGFFALGPYFALRSAPAPLADDEEPPFGFFETRAFGVIMAALTLSIPLSAQVLQVTDWPAALADFGALASGSKLVSVSSADLSVLCVALALLVREDAGRRGSNLDPNVLCAASLLLPAFVPALWMLVRPVGADALRGERAD